MRSLFVQSLVLSSDRSPADVLAHLASRLTPVPDGDRLDEALVPRGSAIGEIRDNVFEVREAMYGFGGASATGVVEPAGAGSRLKARVHPGLWMSFGVPVITIVYAAILWIYFRSFAFAGVSLGRVLAFGFYSCVFVAAWAMLRMEIRSLERLLMDAAGRDRA